MPVAAAEKLPSGITVVHRDEHLLILDKPSGLLSVPGRLPENRDCLASRVQAVWPEALIVHRLDMETSGLIAMARGKEAQRQLSIAFQERRVDKRYVAIVAGLPAADADSVDFPLLTDWPNRPRQMVDFTLGKPSLTHYRVVERGGDRARVELEPVTGRSHQLRVHLLAIGHPILGDKLYAPPEIVAQSPRLLLHAEWLALPHPISGERLEFRAPPPF